MTACETFFRRWPREERTLLSSKFLVIAACVVFIGSLTAYYYVVEAGFNPNPQYSVLPTRGICYPATQACAGFSLSNVTLRVLNLTDVMSQQILFTFTADPGPISGLRVYIDNVSLGAVSGPFDQGSPRLVSLGVPTTITVNPGQSYSLVVEGVTAQSTGGQSQDYWQAIDVIAYGG